MQLTQEAIDEFKVIYKKQFGEDISDAEALEMGTRLLRVFRVLLEVRDQVPTDESPEQT